MTTRADNQLTPQAGSFANLRDNHCKLHQRQNTDGLQGKPYGQW